MTRLERLQLAVEKGFKYDEETGLITTPTRVITSRTTVNGYIHLSVWKDGKRYNITGHQFAWFYMYNEIADCVDHINRIKTDNKKSNLRSVTKSQNAMNMKNVKGYCYCKRSNRYIANIMIDYKKKHLGAFKTEEEARNCYLENKNKYHII